MTKTILPGERRDIQGDGCRLSVTVAGEGPLLILMHGWPELALSWRHLVAPLRRRDIRSRYRTCAGMGLRTSRTIPSPIAWT